MTFGSRRLSVSEWNDRLDVLRFPPLFRSIVSELRAVGYDPPNVEKRLEDCQARYDRTMSWRIARCGTIES